MAKENKSKEQTSTLEESIENLKIQLKENIEKAEHYKIMQYKTQGALEVLLQLEEGYK